eukprot:ANDGO_05229.mRNA.1 Chaperone protein HscA homolog
MVKEMPSTEHKYLGLDLGTQGIRISAFDPSIALLERIPYSEPDGPHPFSIKCLIAATGEDHAAASKAVRDSLLSCPVFVQDATAQQATDASQSTIPESPGEQGQATQEAVSPPRSVASTSSKFAVAASKGPADIKVMWQNQELTPMDVLANVLKNVPEKAGANDVAIALPLSFSSSQKKRFIGALESAGFRVRGVVSEPSAVFLALAILHPSVLVDKAEANYLLVDVGAEYLQCSIISYTREAGLVENIRSSVDSMCTGDEFDRRAIAYLTSKSSLRGVTLPRCLSSLNASRGDLISMLAAAEAAKDPESAFLLSPKTPSTPLMSPTPTSSVAGRNTPGVTPGSSRRFSVAESLRSPSTPRVRGVEVVSLSASKESSSTFHISALAYNTANAETFKMLPNLLRNLLREEGISAEVLDRVLVTGGASRVPRLRFLLEQFFGQSEVPVSYLEDLNLPTSSLVSLGAAAYCGLTAGCNCKYLNKYEVVEDSLSTVFVEYVQGKKLVPLSETPLAYPYDKSLEFGTSLDHQLSMDFRVYEGVRTSSTIPATRNLALLAKLSIANIPRLPVGVFKVHVSVSADSAGIVSVSAASASGQSIEALVTYL